MIPRSWRYAWHNSGDPRIVRARGWVDAVASTRPHVVRSVGEGPVLGYAGLSHGLSHVLPFLEQRRGGPSQRASSRASWADLDVDILAVGYQRRHAPVLPTRHSLVLPFRITLTVPLGPDPDEVLRRVSRKARQQHQRELRSLARTLEVSTQDADFESFYDHMHRPTMDRRHGDFARSESKQNARECILRRGALFFLCEAGRRVAGVLCRMDGQTLVIRLAGVAGGDERHYRSGTYLATFILILRWAAERGFTRVDLSGCEPFLSKGTFRFKRKLHPEVSLPANHFRDKRLLVQVRRDTPATRDYLVANPMMAFGPDGGLEAVYFHDDDRPPRLDLRWQSPGVTGCRLVDLDEFLAGLPVAGRPQVAGRQGGS